MLNKLIITLILTMSSLSISENNKEIVAMEELKMNFKSINEKNKYLNYEKFSMMGDGAVTGMLKEWVFNKNTTEPKEKIQSVKINPDSLFTGASNGLRATWLGHSSFILEVDGLRIMLDPLLTYDVSPVPWIYSVGRFQKELSITAEELPEIDVVVISHDHYDHLDKKTIKAIHSKVKHFLVPKKVDKYLISWGVPKSKIQALDWSHSAVIMDHTFTALPTQHFSGRGLIGRDKTLWASWAIKGPHHLLYFSGDTGYHPALKRIGETYGPFDLVILDSGQFGKYWPKVHMTPEQGVQASVDLQAKLYIPAHWGSFNLSTHNWYDPIERALKAAKEKEINIAVPVVGKTIIVGENWANEEWWSPYKKEDLVKTE